MIFDIGVNLFGDGIFRVDGEKWKEQRQTASPLFHFNNLQSFIPVSFSLFFFSFSIKVSLEIFAECSKTMISIIADHKGKVIDLQQLFMKYPQTKQVSYTSLIFLTMKNIYSRFYWRTWFWSKGGFTWWK